MKKYFTIVSIALLLNGCNSDGKQKTAYTAESGTDKAETLSDDCDSGLVAELASLNDKWRDRVKYDPATVGEELSDYAGACPELFSVDTIGYTVQRRPLLMARMGKGKTPVFALASIHGREYISTVMVMKDIERMLLSYASNTMFGDYNVRKILDECTYYLVPMMNPDGVVIAQSGPDGGCGTTFSDIPIDEASRQYGYSSWKANARGVDLNRNYPQGWKENKRSPAGPNSNEYKGPEPYSEPETKALVAALEKTKPVAVISYHTQVILR